jgi:hypothetical protein
MANVFIALTVPAADGVGPWVDVSSIGPEKTISVDGGPFGGQIYLEASNDAQASAAPAAAGPFPGPTFAPQTFTQTLQFMRVRRSGSNGVGAPTVTLAGPAAISNVFGAMAVPAGDGIGAAIDLSGGGDVNTFQVEGPYSGQILIETSTDGVNFSPTLLFTVFHGVGQTVTGVLSAARVRRRGSTTAAVPLISVGSGATSGGGGGGFPGFGPAPPPVAIASAAGAAGTASRSDHTHAAAVLNLAAGAGITVTPVAGTWTIAATAVSFPGYGGAPPAVTTAGSSAGVAATVSRSDHTHSGVHSLVAGTNVSVADDGAGNITVNSTGAVFPGYGGAPPAVTTAGSSAGAALTVSRSDHTHSGVHSLVAGTNITIADDGAGNITVNSSGGAFPGYGGAPPAVAAASSAGAALTVSRSDHTHQGVASVTASTGLTNTGTASAVVLTNNLSTGINAASQTAVGGTLTTQSLLLRPNLADLVTGTVAMGSTTGWQYTASTNAVSLGIAASTAGSPMHIRGNINGAWGPYVNNGNAAGGGGGTAAGYYFGQNDDNNSGPLASLTMLGALQGTAGLYAANEVVLAMTGGAADMVFHNQGTGGIKFGAGGGAGTQYLRISNAGQIQTSNNPFVSYSSGAVIAQANGNVHVFGQVPPNIARASALDAILFNPATVTLTGGAGAAAAQAATRFAPVTWQTSGAAMTGQPVAVEIDGPIFGANFTPNAGAPAAFALLLNDNVGQGTAHLGLSDGILFGSQIQGWTNAGATTLSIGVVAATQLLIKYNMVGDGSGGTVAMSVNGTNGATAVGLTASAVFTAGIAGQEGLTVIPNAAGADVALGVNAHPAAAATHGLPYMPVYNASPTGAPSAFANMAPFAFDHLLTAFRIQNGGGGWELWPAFEEGTLAPGAGVIVTTNLPAGFNTTPKYWAFTSKLGTSIAMQYFTP